MPQFSPAATAKISPSAMFFLKLVTWLLAVFRRERFDIGRWDGEHNDDYLIRWTLIGRRSQGDSRVFLHFFWRGDWEDYLHDHPWPFTSVILWGGYWEIADAVCMYHPIGEKQCSSNRRFPDRCYWCGLPMRQTMRWYNPLTVLKRPATWRHRVELPKGRIAWTLVFSGKKQRSWGFWCPSGFLPWRKHEANVLAGMPGCGE